MSEARCRSSVLKALGDRPTGFAYGALLTVALLPGGASALPREAGQARGGFELTSEAVAIDTSRRDFEDPQRSNWTQTGRRPLRTLLWYPSGAGATPSTRTVAGSRHAIARDAPRVADARNAYPMVLVSHGSGSRAAHMAWLGQALARRGLIVAAVEHNGSAEEELHSKPTPSDHFGWERARDLSVVLDLLLADPEFGPAIDRGRIGAAGFSLGGTTVLWLAGARLDLDHLRRNAPPMPSSIAPAIERLLQLPRTNEAARLAQGRAERSYRDRRIRSVFALAPAMGFAFAEAGLRDVRIPSAIVVGTADVVNPAPDNARYFAEHIRESRYTELAGEGGHFTGKTPAQRQHVELENVARIAQDFFAETLAVAPAR